MALTFRPKFNPANIRAALKEQQRRIEQAVYMRLQRVGEQFVRDARESGAYTDQTGNLRSSIGYIILKDGVQVGANFEGNTEGQAAAQNAVASVAQYPTGFILIVVAGMEYAAAVESKGFDVLTMSSIKAETSLKQAMKALQAKL